MAPSRKVGTRCLAIMEQLAGGVGDSGRGLMLADALMPLLQQSAASRYARMHIHILSSTWPCICCLSLLQLLHLPNLIYAVCTVAAGTT